MVGTIKSAKEAYEYERELIANGKLRKSQAGIQRATNANGRVGFKLRRVKGSWAKAEFVYPNSKIWARGVLAKYGFNYWSKTDRELDAQRNTAPRKVRQRGKNQHTTDKKNIVRVGKAVGHI